MSDPSSSDPAGPALGTMFVLGGTAQGYEDGMRRTAAADHPVDGMVLHWSAQLDAGTITGTLWRERGLAEHYLAKVLAVTFTDISGEVEQLVRPRPDFSYELVSVHNFTAGEAAAKAVGLKVGEAAGAVLLRPTGGMADLDLSAGVPDGLIAHVSTVDDVDFPWMDLWLDPLSPDGAYSSTALEIIPLHTLFVNPTELSMLPVFPPTA